MSREIKFRIWNKNADSFINPNLFIFINQSKESVGINDIFHYKDYSFQQFTGLKDKNGKEIYEGDIVKFSTWNCPQVHPNIEDYLTNVLKQIVYGLNCGGQYPTAGFCAISLQPTDLEDGHQLNWMDSRNIEIIGNIFENPELLD